MCSNILDNWFGIDPKPEPTVTAPRPVFDPSPWRQQVDSAFSQFNPDFYANQAKQVLDPYKAALTNQYGTAKDTLEANIAGRGLQNSNQARGLFSNLDTFRDDLLKKTSGELDTYKAGLARDVSGAKNSLYGTIGEGADNSGVGTRAAEEAARIAGTPAPAPSMGDLFGSFLKNYAPSKGPTSLTSDPNQPTFAPTGSLNLAGKSGGPEASTTVVNDKRNG